jgi:Beta-galactosidase/beta-glucuronidase
MSAQSLLVMVMLSATVLQAAAQRRSPDQVVLSRDWAIQSSCVAKAGGEQISTRVFRTRDWIPTLVPATVFAAQVAAGIYKDPFYDMNLRKVPGVGYPIGENYSKLPMPDDSPYHCSWWYRTTFPVTVQPGKKRVHLHFGGINYRANIWLNGKQVANSDDVQGAYRTYDFDVTNAARAGNTNVLAVEVFAPEPRNLAINWVGWNPMPPDKDMGLWRPVTLYYSGPVGVISPAATTRFSDDDLTSADETVTVQLSNTSDASVNGIVSGTLAGVRFQKSFSLAANQQSTITFSSADFPQLKIPHPEIWWPRDMGAPKIVPLTVTASVNGRVSDSVSARVGLREITSELTDKGARLFRVNHKPILIRGGGWSPDMLLRANHQRLLEDFRLLNDMRLNTIRLEGKLESEDFFDLADQQGILVMAGWCCCDFWEEWKDWNDGDLKIANASLESQMLRLRNHPSLLVWLNGSDNPPPANVETAYLETEKRLQWPNPVLSSASQAPTSVTGASGVKRTGPYDYVAPSYWYVDNAHGGAFGFNTETSPGPAIPSIAGLQTFIPQNHLWPIDEQWSYHAGGGKFKDLTYFNDAMNATYGPANDLPAYTRIAQTMQYNGERAMFEAYGRNKYTSTGVIQWMLNNAWPSLIWHLYTYDHETDGGYFGTKKALEPLHIQYSYDDHSVWVVNSTYQPASGLSASATVFDPKLKPLFTKSSTIDFKSDSSQRAIEIPDSIFSPDSQLYFVRLQLKNPSGKTVSDNFYWVPSKLTEFDWSKTEYNVTPALSHDVMTSLRDLPKAKLRSTVHWRSPEELAVDIENGSDALAFQIETTLEDEAGNPLRPQMWSDNYISLQPHEKRSLSLRLPKMERSKYQHLTISGWNIETIRERTR